LQNIRSLKSGNKLNQDRRTGPDPARDWPIIIALVWGEILPVVDGARSGSLRVLDLSTVEAGKHGEVAISAPVGVVFDLEGASSGWGGRRCEMSEASGKGRVTPQHLGLNEG
jgi:hypothetical protein